MRTNKVRLLNVNKEEVEEIKKIAHQHGLHADVIEEGEKVVELALTNDEMVLSTTGTEERIEQVKMEIDYYLIKAFKESQNNQ